jgi:serine/threonine protein kinase
VIHRLCGFPPFVEDETGMESVYRKIKAGALEFPHPYWTNVSEAGRSITYSSCKIQLIILFVAKNLIFNLLSVAPQERFSAAAALEHPWIKVCKIL